MGSFSQSASSFIRVLFLVFNLASSILQHPNGVGLLSRHCPGIAGPWGAVPCPPWCTPLHFAVWRLRSHLRGPCCENTPPGQRPSTAAGQLLGP